MADHTRNHIEKTVYAPEEEIDEARMSYYSSIKIREDQLHDIIRKTDESPRRMKAGFSWRSNLNITDISGMQEISNSPK